MDEGVLNDTTGHLLQDLRLIDDAGHLNRAAVLLFHPDPERYVFGAYIKIGFFRDDKGNLEFQDEIHGALMEQVDKAMDLIKTKYLIYRISYEGISRRETPQFPVESPEESSLSSFSELFFEFIFLFQQMERFFFSGKQDISRPEFIPEFFDSGIHIFPFSEGKESCFGKRGFPFLSAFSFVGYSLSGGG